MLSGSFPVMATSMIMPHFASYLRMLDHTYDSKDKEQTQVLADEVFKYTYIARGLRKMDCGNVSGVHNPLSLLFYSILF